MTTPGKEAAPVLYAVDLDRTLMRTDTAFGLISHAAADHGVPGDVLEAEKRAVEASRGSFDVLGHISGQVGSDTLEQIKEEFVAHADPGNLLYDGAVELFDTLERRGAPYLILTYGGQDWQALKLKAAGLFDRRHLITDEKDKGRLIAGWKQADSGLYVPPTDDGPELAAESVVLIDDKPSSFDGLPGDCKGILVRHNGEVLKASQNGEIPSNVVAVGGIREVISSLPKNISGGAVA